MQAAKFQRLYILLRPCSRGGGGYARLEQARGKYTLTVNAHGFSPSEEGLRVLLAARDEGGGAAVCDLGSLPISPKGQSSLRREIAAMPGGLPLDAYTALCIAKDWPDPKLLYLGALEENTPLSAYLMGETVRRYLSVPAKSAASKAAKEDAPPPALSLPPDDAAPIPPPSGRSFMPAAPTVPFPVGEAAFSPKPALAPIRPEAAANPLADDPRPESLDPVVFTSAMERAALPAPVPAAVPPSGRPPVTALPKLHWPAAVKELENYFSTCPPFAPFDAPGWRFVQVPMAAGSTIPFYAVGMLARDGKVTQVAYAVPGERGGLPPAGFSGYRWQQGRNGQGYWTLWKRA